MVDCSTIELGNVMTILPLLLDDGSSLLGLVIANVYEVTAPTVIGEVGELRVTSRTFGERLNALASKVVSSTRPSLDETLVSIVKVTLLFAKVLNGFLKFVISTSSVRGAEHVVLEHAESITTLLS